MATMSLAAMQAYLSKSITSLNQNKLNGLLAEVDLRNHLHDLGFGSRVSVGGWIARSVGTAVFGSSTIVFFPEIINPANSYPTGRPLPAPPLGLHTICSTFHQIGIYSYYLTPTIGTDDDPSSLSWSAKQLGLPVETPWVTFPADIAGFSLRKRRHNFLKHKTDITSIPAVSAHEEFSKEHVRVTFQSRFMQEMSDVDGVLWGHQYTYPIEIKEKTAANDKKVGDYFGLDVGPFVKLAYYAAKKGNLHSLFIVREIDNPVTRNLVQWWFIRFDTLAQYASWQPVGGGKNMLGGSSTTVKIPKDRFSPLDKAAVASL